VAALAPCILAVAPLTDANGFCRAGTDVFAATSVLATGARLDTAGRVAPATLRGLPLTEARVLRVSATEAGRDAARLTGLLALPAGLRTTAEAILPDFRGCSCGVPLICRPGFPTVVPLEPRTIAFLETGFSLVARTTAGFFTAAVWLTLATGLRWPLARVTGERPPAADFAATGFRGVAVARVAAVRA
jgi:hypothetical protein